jgi:hypothetical protein
MDLIFIKNIIPDELIQIIFSYIPLYRLVFLNKTLYFSNHKLLKIHIPNYDNYIRDIIRNDNRFVFNLLLFENYKKWKNIKKYNYKNIICYDYLSFVRYFIILNKSNNCKKELDDFISETGSINKNEFKKKNIIINKRWKN